MEWEGIKRARGRLAREAGAIVKDWGGRLPFALVYPNSYYLGMSNLGLHALYKLLNRPDKLLAERVFWEGDAPVSIESQRPLADFPVLAFTVSYELDYFNIVRLLRAAGIPLYAAERDASHPLLLAGGPCVTANPAPLAPFFDAMAIGEAEAIMPDLLPVLTDGIGGDRDELLKTLAKISGLYVPAHPPEKPVLRRYAADLDAFPVSSVVLTRDTELGDLYLIEAERGCNWGCRFCLAGRAFFPMRCRSLEVLLEQAGEGLKYRKSIGLVGAAVADHPQAEALLARLREMGARVSISSLRLAPLSDAVLAEVVRGGGQTVTLAPEAGSERLRKLIKKGVTGEDVVRALEKAAALGVRQVKLYFMFGLPTETDEDVKEMVSLAAQCKDILDRQRAGSKLSLNVAPFVPKAGTPFQWLPMTPANVLDTRLALLKQGLSPLGIKVKAESPAWSQVQGVLARGDERLAAALAATGGTALAAWQQALAECGLDADCYIRRTWDDSQKLPWGMRDIGVKPGFLEMERDRALAAT